MKRLLLILILTFCFQSLSKADDIRDFEIEGMSIGDSLLNHFTEKQINNAKKTFYQNDKYYDVQLDLNNYETWPILSISVEKNDKNYIVHSMAGAEFINSLNECNKMSKIIVNDLKKTFNNFNLDKYEYVYDHLADGKSIAYITDFVVNNGKYRVYCTDWSVKTENEFGYADNIRMEAGSNKYYYWLDNESTTSN